MVVGGKEKGSPKRRRSDAQGGVKALRAAMESEKDKFLLVLGRLRKRDGVEPFLVPVDWVAMDLPDYPEIVTRPMDLKTIERKVKADLYPSSNEFFADIELIWANCQLYNEEISEVHQQSKALQKYSDSLKVEMFPEVLKGGESNTSVIGQGGKKVRMERSEVPRVQTDSTKLKFRIHRLSNHHLSLLMKYLAAQHGEGLEKISPEKKFRWITSHDPRDVFVIQPERLSAEALMRVNSLVKILLKERLCEATSSPSNLRIRMA